MLLTQLTKTEFACPISFLMIGNSMFPSVSGTQLYNIANIFHQKLICGTSLPRNVPLTSKPHSFLIVLEVPCVCLRPIEQTNHITENLNDVTFCPKMWIWQIF